MKNEYLERRGNKVKELSRDILIDDMSADVNNGCNKYNVKLIHLGAI